MKRYKIKDWRITMFGTVHYVDMVSLLELSIDMFSLD